MLRKGEFGLVPDPRWMFSQDGCSRFRGGKGGHDVVTSLVHGVEFALLWPSSRGGLERGRRQGHQREAENIGEQLRPLIVGMHSVRIVDGR